MFTRQKIDLETVLDTLQGIELRQREIDSYLHEGEAMPRLLQATLADIADELRQMRFELQR